MYEDDLFDVGPILGKGYPEFNENQDRDPKSGRWVRGGANPRSKSPKGKGAGGKKPATSKPKSTAKPKASAPKKPASKPKTKKPEPKAEAKPARKPRTPKSKSESTDAAKPEGQSTALVPSNRDQPIEVQAEPVPEKPAPGLVERDRKRLDDMYSRYDELNAEIDRASNDWDQAKEKLESISSELKYARRDSYREHSLSKQYEIWSDRVASLGRRMSDKAAQRAELRSSIEALDRSLRGQKRYVAKLFSDSTALDFKAAFNKVVPDNGQPAGGDVGNPLGLVFGWAIVCKDRGRPYFDTQGDHIPEESMLKAATDFMLHRRDLKVMHKGKRVGTVVFAWPVTKDIAKAMGLDGTKTGLMIGVKPDSSTIVDRFRDGQYTGFSIGGNRLIDEPVV